MSGYSQRYLVLTGSAKRFTKVLKGLGRLLNVPALQLTDIHHYTFKPIKNCSQIDLI